MIVEFTLIENYKMNSMQKFINFAIRFIRVNDIWNHPKLTRFVRTFSEVKTKKKQTTKMSHANVTVTRTVTSSSPNAIFINIGYLKTAAGALKLVQLVMKICICKQMIWNYQTSIVNLFPDSWRHCHIFDHA